jgi:hypothetical protein
VLPRLLAYVRLMRDAHETDTAEFAVAHSGKLPAARTPASRGRREGGRCAWRRSSLSW